MSSTLERLFLSHVAQFRLPMPVQEMPFMDGRKWRFDFAWPEYRIALEIEGGTHIGGRHNRGKGYEADCEKYNCATLAGWAVLRATGDMVKTGMAAAAVSTMIEKRIAEGG